MNKCSPYLHVTFYVHILVVAIKFQFQNPSHSQSGPNIRCRWVNNIKMELRETGLGDRDWIYLAQDGDQWRSLVNMVMNLQVP
jgi:hypothetical protein